MPTILLIDYLVYKKEKIITEKYVNDSIPMLYVNQFFPNYQNNGHCQFTQNKTSMLIVDPPRKKKKEESQREREREREKGREKDSNKEWRERVDKSQGG